MTKLKVMSYNIRYNNPQDGINAWPNRKARVTQLIKNHKPHLIGLQEVLQEQLEFLQSELSDYHYVGVARNDGKQAGEYAPIFYLKDSFELQDNATFWLSETPNQIGTIGWDASLPRIATWANFKHKATKQSFYHFNTHFDHKGQKAREKSSQLLLTQIKQKSNNQATIVTGDFNLEPNSTAYKTLSTTLKDSFTNATNHDGSSATCLEFKVGETKGVRIDYIFHTQDFKATSYQAITQNRNGYYPSDHLPIITELN